MVFLVIFLNFNYFFKNSILLINDSRNDIKGRKKVDISEHMSVRYRKMYNSASTLISYDNKSVISALLPTLGKIVTCSVERVMSL